MRSETFQKLVGRVFDTLPAKLRAETAAIPVVVKEEPSPGAPENAQVGIIQSASGVRIEVYQKNFDSGGKTGDQVYEQLKSVLLEELNFYFES